MTCSKYCILVVTDDNKVYCLGRSRCCHFHNDGTSFDQFTDVSALFGTLKQENIVEVKSGSHFSCFITDTGKLLIRGQYLQSLLELGDDHSNLIYVPLPDKYFVKHVYCSVNKKRYPVCIIEVYDKNENKTKILSAGQNSYGVLG